MMVKNRALTKSYVEKNRNETINLIKKREQLAKNAIYAHNEIYKLNNKINNNHNKVYSELGDSVGDIDNNKTSKYACRYSDMTT